MASKREQVIEAVVALLAGLAVTNLAVKREEEEPDELPRDPLFIVEDGLPVEDDVTLGLPPVYFWRHPIPVTLLLQAADLAAARERGDEILLLVEAALEVDRSLGGLCQHIEGADLETAQDYNEGAAPRLRISFNLVAWYDSQGALV